MDDVPTYSGFASESSGRILDQAPSAPTRRPVLTVGLSAKVTSCLTSPRGRTLVTLCPHWIISSGSGLSSIRRRSPLEALAGLGVEWALRLREAAENLNASTAPLGTRHSGHP